MMEIKAYIKDFKDIEFYLFSLKFNKEIKIKLSFYDSDEVYYYKTTYINNDLVLETI